MTQSLSPADIAKRAAAATALELVEDGMTLGLGTGSTAAWFVQLLGEALRAGELRDIRGVATSSATVRQAHGLGISLLELGEAGRLDLTIDGADEFDPALNLIKGGGAALLQEKIVAAASSRMVVIADAGKQVADLGAFPLPVEIVRFGWSVTRDLIARTLEDADVAGRDLHLRQTGDAPLVTDEGHYILDLHLKRIGDPPALARRLSILPGVVEHGLFIGMASQVIVGHADATTTIVRAET